MARRTDQVKLDSPTARKRLPPKHSAYWNVISTGCAIGYRRASATKAGVWQAMYTPARDSGSKMTRLWKSLGAADDFMPADGATCFSFEQARRKAIDWFPIALQKATGGVPTPKGFTVADACREYLDSLFGSRSEYITRVIVKRSVEPFLGGILVEKLMRGRIEAWRKALVEKPRRKPRHGLEADSDEAVRRRKDTANRYLTVLKAALNRALTEGRVACTGLAWKQVRAFKGVGQARTRFLSDDECRRLVAACDPSFRVLVQAALFSGARYSELARLQVCDFESSSNTLFIAQSKSGNARRIFLDPEASEFFQDSCRGRAPHELLLTIGEKMWKKDMAKGLVSEAASAAQIPKLTFHELRHTAASRWARLGLSLAEIAAQLGHRDVRMTQRYAHLCTQTLSEKMRGMPAFRIYDPRAPQVVTIQ